MTTASIPSDDLTNMLRNTIGENASASAIDVATTSGQENPSKNGTYHYTFSSVPGVFVDFVEIAKGCPGSKLTRQPLLGILDRTYDDVDSQSDDDATPQWTKLARYLQRLNENSARGESYKLLYLIRHGLGVHNIVMERVGSQAWKDHWSHLDGDGEDVWADAHLVDAGIAQAKQLAQFWLDEVKDHGIPLPETVYTSPLARCLETTRLVYTPVMSVHHMKLQPIVKESLREFMTDHTCDRRSSRSWIRKNYPEYTIEDSLSEDDNLWNADMPETLEAHRARKRKLLEEIFADDDAGIISLTTHSYAISAILDVVGAPKFRVGEGAIVPILVKAEKIAPIAGAELTVAVSSR